MSTESVVYLIRGIDSGRVYGALSDPYETVRAASIYRSGSVRLLECRVFPSAEEWWVAWSQSSAVEGGGVSEMARGGSIEPRETESLPVHPEVMTPAMLESDD